MSFRGNRGRGRGNFGGRGRGGRGGYHQDQGPPEHVIEIGSFLHPCENDLVCKSTHAKIPYFNAPIYLENKTQIGKIDDIFGPMTDFFFSVKLSPNMVATSFKSKEKLFIDPMKLLPLARFLPAPKGARGGGVQKRGGRGGGRGGARGRGGGRGGFRGGGRGSSRGGGFRGRGGRGRGR